MEASLKGRKEGILDPSTDDQLMARVQGGDLSALGVLFDRHHARLRNFFLRLTSRKDRSDDLVQDVFLRILKYGKTYRGEAPFTLWMYQLARNAMADSYRKHQLPVSGNGQDVADPSLSLPDRLAQSEEVALLRTALLRLDPERREVLVLRRFEGLTYEEIAELLGCTAGTAKVRAHRALIALRDAYSALLKEKRP
jgi:RNA polymerase sigma factor (sigma-70 family)